MNCISCGRPLASGAKCVYCGQGTKFMRREELQIPEGTIPQRGRGSGIPWGGILVVLVAGALLAACFLHPEISAKIRSLMPF